MGQRPAELPFCLRYLVIVFGDPNGGRTRNLWRDKPANSLLFFRTKVMLRLWRHYVNTKQDYLAIFVRGLKLFVTVADSSH